MKTIKIPIFNPFKIDIAPMERLLLVNFQKDPDSIYMGFEPQVFNDSIHGKVHLILGWRQDGKVDVYHQSCLTLDPETYDIAGKGLGKMVTTDFSEAIYEINDRGVQASYEFMDLHQRIVKIIITENHPKKRKPFGLLAPMGDAAENPSAMPLVLLHDFYFVRKKSTVIDILIDGKSHQPDELPLPLDGSKMLFTRYSPRPLIATFNPAFDDVMKPLKVNPRESRMIIPEEETELILDWIDDRPRIKKLIRRNEICPVTLEFHNPFPDLLKMENQTSLQGGFDLQGHPTTGKIGGHYLVEKMDDEIKIILIPSKGWKPKPSKLSLRFLYAVAKIFKHWPKTYEWTALIRVDRDGEMYMQSNWKRNR